MEEKADKSENILKKLSRWIEETYKIRFRAANILNHHNLLSQITLACLAVFQIIISLIEPFGIKVQSPSEDIIYLVNTFFSVMVLSYSLLLSMANFSTRANKMHQCGLELSALNREILGILELELELKEPKKLLEKYTQYCNKYNSILDKYDNHTTNHFKLNETYDSYKMYLFLIKEFWHYYLLLILMVVWIVIICVSLNK